MNRTFTGTDQGFVLVGPGRWGSSDPWLGIPVKWPHISNARVIVECGFLTNAADEALLLTQEYRLRLAETICSGTLAYLAAMSSGDSP